MTKMFFKGLLFIWLMLLPAILVAQTEQTTDAPAGDDIVQADTSQMTDIHDIKPPARLGWHRPWWWIALAAVLVVLAAALAYWLKRRKASTAAVEITQPPDQIAQALLREMADFRQMDGKTFYFGLSAIIRDYILGRFGLNAPDLTTEELLPRLSEMPLNGELTHGLADLLRASEPIKYADGLAIEDQMQQDWLFAQRFVAETALEEEAPTDQHPKELPQQI
jgi:hypothetical protein